MMALLGYLADAYLLAAYAYTVKTQRQRVFHWANAIACVPLVAIEITAHVWPVLVVTAMFGVLGWLGVLRGGK